MSNALILKRTNVPGRQPDTSELEKNEIVYNSHDGRVYIKKIVNGTQSIQEVGGVTSVNGYKFDVSLNTDDIPEGPTNRYFTEDRAKLSLYPGTGVFYDNANGIISIGQPVGTGDSVTFVDVSIDGVVRTNIHTIDTTESTSTTTGALVVDGGTGIAKNLNVGGDTSIAGNTNIGGNTVIEGNLTVRGTTTTVESEVLTVADNMVLLNSNIVGAPTENAGIEVQRGTENNVQFRWNESNGYWEFTEDGINYHRLNKLYAGTNISHNQTTGVIAVVQGHGSGLDADTLDGYQFTDLEDRYVNVTGDSMTGSITFTEHDRGLIWTRGTDSASLKFYDTSDTDPNGRLEFKIAGSGTEYYRWIDGSNTELLKLDPAGGVNGLTMRGGTVWHSGNDGHGTGMDADTVDGYHFSDLEDRFVNVTGDTMTGNLTFSDHSEGIVWSAGGDSASMKFYNVSAADPNGRLEYSIGGAGNEYYRWVDGSGTELMRLAPDGGVNGLTMRGGTVWHSGNDGAGTGMDSDLLDGQHGTYYLDYPNLTNRPVFFYEFASGVASPTPSAFPDLMLTGFNAPNSTDLPVAAMSGITVKGPTVGAQLAMGWDAEENSPEQIHFRVNDSSSSTNAWGAWQRIAIGQPVRTTDSPTFKQITVTDQPKTLNQIATLGDLISVPGDLAINTIGSIDIQLTTSNQYSGSVSGTPSYISSVSGASLLGNAPSIGSNYSVMQGQYSSSGNGYVSNVTFVIDIANACGLQNNKYSSGTTINPKWKGNFMINAFSALFKMSENNFWDYVGNNATWEYSINMIPVTTDPDNSNYGKFNVSAKVWAAKTYHNANIGARWLGTATKYRNLV